MFNVYEVFVQKDHASPHLWVGSVDAGSPDDALLLARENFLRREAAVSIWVVLQAQVHRTDYADPDFFAQESDKQYRTLAGYSKANAEKWRKYKKNLLDLEKDFVKER
jgi:ring-1,2-phenylacetyl-CoA epoxidase subunit PaaB